MVTMEASVEHPTPSVKVGKSVGDGLLQRHLGGGFKQLLYVFFLPLPGEMIQLDQYLSDGLKPPTRVLIWIGDIQTSLVSMKKPLH